MPGFVKVANEVFKFRKMALRHVAVRLYELGDEWKWGPFPCADSYLMDDGPTKRDVRRVMETLTRKGLMVIVKPGDRQNARIVRVFDPSPEPAEKADHAAYHDAYHGNDAKTGNFEESGPRPEPEPELNYQTTNSNDKLKEQAAADFVVALAIYNDHVRSSFDQPMSPTKLKPSKGQGLHLAQLIKAEGLADVIEVFQWWSTAQDQGLRGGAAFHRAERSTIETIRRRFDGYLDKARNPYKASANGSSNGSGSMKAEAAAVLGKINVMIRDPRWNPADLGDSEHAEAARAGLAACGGIDDFRRSRDEIGDRIRFVAGYVERRSNP